MIYCPECGAENPDGSSFCQKCGTNIPVMENSKESKTPPENFWMKQTKNGKILIGTVFICFITSIVILSLIYTGTTSTSHYEDENLAFDYISGWKLTKDSNMLVEGSYDYAGVIKFNAEKNSTNNRTLEVLKDDYKSEITSNGYKVISEKPITVDGVSAYEIDSITNQNGESSQQRKILLVKNNSLYGLLFTTEADLISYRRSMDTIINSIHIKL